MKERGSWIGHLLDRVLGTPALPIAAMVRRLERHRFRAVENKRRVVLTCYGALGDLFLTSGAIRTIKRHWPDCRITVVTSTANAGGACLLPDLDDHKTFPIRSVVPLLRFLRGSKFDVLIDTSQWARFGALMAALSGAAICVGFRTKGQQRGYIYDIAVPHKSDVHEWQNFMSLAHAIGATEDLPCGLLDLGCARSALSPAGEYVVCHLWSAGKRRAEKEWALESWAEVIGACVEAGNAVVLTGADADVCRAQGFIEYFIPMSKRESVVDLVGKTSLAELVPLLHGAQAVVSVNTGVMHLAALAQAPTISLDGPTNPGRWGPIGARVRSVCPEEGPAGYLDLGFERCPRGGGLSGISVAQVLGALADWNVIGK